MGNKINILDKNIDKFDSDSINNEIDRVIKRFSDNKVFINRMVFDSIALLTEAETAEEKLTNKGPLKRLIGAISGSNRKLADQIRSNRGKALYLAQQMLQKIAEEQLLTLDVIANIDNRLNFHIKDLNTKINNINKNLRLFLSTYKEGLIAISKKIEKHDRDIALLTWLSTLGYQEFNGIKYKDLDELTKIVCIIKDFYALTQGNWSQSDLLMIRVALDNLNISFDLEFNYLDALLKIQSKSELNNIFICNKEYNLSDDLSKSFIILNVFEKLTALECQDKYLLDICKKINDNMLSDFELKRELIKSYVIYNYQIDIDNLITPYNFILDFLYNLNYFYAMNCLNSEIDNNVMLGEERLVDKEEEIITLESKSYPLETYKMGLEALNSGLNDKAYKLFSESVEAGGIEAIYELAKCYYYGIGVKRNYSMALKFCNHGVEFKHYNCYYLLACIYENGYGVEVSINKAKEYYKLIIDLGDDISLISISQNNLAEIFWAELDENENREEIVKLYESSYNNGYYKAMTNLGVKYHEGIGVYKDNVLAVHYLLLAAKYNDSFAQCLLGEIFKYGHHGITKNIDKEFYWLKLSADNNCARAMYSLVLGYALYPHYGLKSKEGKRLSIEYNIKSAQLGFEPAIRLLKSKLKI